MFKKFWLLLFTVTCFKTYSAHGQERQLPAELRSFVLSGHEWLDFATGDLNGDRKEDAILILKRIGEDSLEDPTPRPLILLLRQENGSLKKELQNDKAIMCRQCGGIFGDPYQDLSIGRDGFEISFYGGSAWRWTYLYAFHWRPAKKTWILTREEHGEFNSMDPQMTMKETVIPESELGEISLSAFNSDPVYEDSRWKVIAAKTWFHPQPQAGGKRGKAYLVKGDTVTGIRQLKTFIEVSFTNKRSETTQGFILRKDLVRL